jgi:hypothetical protein
MALSQFLTQWITGIWILNTSYGRNSRKVEVFNVDGRKLMNFVRVIAWNLK